MKTSSSRLLRLLRGQSIASKVLGAPATDMGLAEGEPFPFLAIVGQEEMKLALLLAVINPAIGGVLLIGARGTAKTTAVRSLVDLLPHRRRSLCPNGCTEELLNEVGLDGICTECAQRIGYNEPLTIEDRVRIIELPLNARLDDVIGGVNDRLALEQRRLKLERGILAFADGNVLFIDEVNLLDDAITNAILDAAAQGYYTVRRGPLNLRYRSQFTLVGTMNPEEGTLRPQIMDRFGLRAVVRGLADPEMRFVAYEQAIAYRRNPDWLSANYAGETLVLADELQEARTRLYSVTITPEAKQAGLKIIRSLNIYSSRAEITLFESARAYAAADERLEVNREDIETVAVMALRSRESKGMAQFLEDQEQSDQQLRFLLKSDIDRQSHSEDASREP
ncbi:MAG TPA: magnesium chelatase [Patescibacteria group bacterium]|nr:magnesium chelatase [Patescibacteria group bacterium]